MKTKLDRYDLSILIKGVYSMRDCYGSEIRDRIYDLLSRLIDIFDNMDPKRYGHLMVYYRRWRDDDTQMLTTYALRNHEGDPEISYEDCRNMVLSDLETMKNPAETVHYEKDWYYFPHVDSKTYASGWYERVEGM